MKTKTIISTTIAMLAFLSCSTDQNKSDAYGNFESKEIIVSAEGQGKILWLNAEEGDLLQAGQQIGQIDTSQLWFTREQLLAKKRATATKTTNILSQIKVYDEQLKVMNREKERIEKLMKDGAATSQQYDDITGKIDITAQTIQSIRTQNSSVLSEIEAVENQILQIDDQLNKCRIINPIKGTILEKYTENYEIAIPGKAIYKIADLSEMELRVYVDGSQLTKIKIGQTASVFIDNDKENNKKLEGTISWISPQAEFTPKIIQTKKERVSLVYAVKIRLKNDGELKIGMPGEVVFNK